MPERLAGAGSVKRILGLPHGGHVVATDQLGVLSRSAQSVAITGGTGLYRSGRGRVVYRMTSETSGSGVFTIITP